MKIMSYVMYNNCWKVIVAQYSAKLKQLKQEAKKLETKAEWNLFTFDKPITVTTNMVEDMNNKIAKHTKNMQKICANLIEMKKHKVKNGYECHNDEFYNFCNKILNRKVDA